MSTDHRSSYQRKLLDPRWQKKRLAILVRDNWRCQFCGSITETLHVHHRYYIHGRDPWAYDNEGLLTLCAECHSQETTDLPIVSARLIEAIKRAGFTSESIKILADTFWKIKYQQKWDMTQQVLAEAIEDLLTDGEALAEFVERFEVARHKMMDDYLATKEAQKSERLS